MFAVTLFDHDNTRIIDKIMFLYENPEDCNHSEIYKIQKARVEKVLGLSNPSMYS